MSECLLRVVYVDHVARLSGGEIALVRLLRALEGRVQPHVILAEAGPLQDQLDQHGISHEVLTLSPDVRDVARDSGARGSLSPIQLAHGMRFTLRLAGRIARLNPDLVHANSLKAGVFGSVAGRLAGVPVVWHVRDRLAPDYMPPSAAWMMRQLVRTLPSAVVTNSEATRLTLRSRKSQEVLYNVVHEITDPQENTQPAGPQTGPFVAGLVGRLAPWKGQDVFLRAFAAAFPDGDERAVLIGSAIFGEDDYAARLNGLADELGITERVEFRGFRDDVPAEMRRLSVLVHASTSPEPFGQVVIEGMAAGLPVIATAEGGPAEIITDGVDGLLCRAGDPQHLAEILRSLRDDPERRRRLGAAGRERARDFSPERAAEKMMEIYRDVLASAR